MTTAPARILLACDTLPTNPWSRDRLPAIRQAAAEWDLDVIDIYEFHSREEARTIHREAREEFFAGANVDFAALNAALLERIQAYAPDVLILGTADCYSRFLLPETVGRLREQGVYTAGILGDDEFTHQNNVLYAPLFDAAVVYVRSFVERYRAMGAANVHWLPNSCYFPEPDFDALQAEDADKRFDAILMGAPFGVRPKLVRALLDAGVDVGLFGSPRWREFPDLAPHYRGFVPHDAIGDVMRSARVVISPLEDHLSGALHMNTKLWDAVKHGQFSIATRYEPLLSDYGFVEGEDIALYGSETELVEQVIRYRDDPEERTRVARAMFERTRDNFDYVRLYRELFADLDAARRESRTAEPTTTVTIVDVSGSGVEHSGFAQVNLPRFRWRRDLRRDFDKLIRTPYVLVTRGGLHYSPYLNAVVSHAPHRFRAGRLLLRPWRDPALHAVADTGRVVWKRDALRARLRRTADFWRWSWVRRLPNGHGNLRLCRRERRGPGRWLAGLARVATGLLDFRQRRRVPPAAPAAKPEVAAPRVYGLHDRIDVVVSGHVSDALRRSIEFQIGHFRCAESTAPVRIEVHPYESDCLQELEPLSRFHLSSGVAGRGIDMPGERVALRVESWGYTLYLERGSGFLMLAIQLLLTRQEHSLVHAGAIADPDGRVILLPGAGGVGKTALVGALAQQGRARLLGDDLVLLSSAAHVRSLPREFVLKDYHRDVLPEAFGDVPTRREIPVAARRVLRRLYRNAPLRGVTESLLARTGALPSLRARLSPSPATPPPRTVDVASLFGRECVAGDGPLREVVFLERVDDLAFGLEPMDAKSLVMRMASIVHHEWTDHMRAFWQLGSMEIADLPAYLAETTRILESGTASVPIHRLRIPDGATPAELVDFFGQRMEL
jgi:hypothetical protein